MFDGDDTHDNNIQENIEKKDEDNIDLPIADLYSHADIIMYMH